jgi:hypothetical protein
LTDDEQHLEMEYLRITTFILFRRLLAEDAKGNTISPQEEALLRMRALTEGRGSARLGGRGP